MYSWIIPLGGVGNLDFSIPLAITRLRDKHTMRDDDGQLIAESWNGEFRTPEIVTEIDKIEFLVGFDIRDDSDIGKRRRPTKESRDRRRRRVHRALTRFAEQERGIIAEGSGLWKVDSSCEEMKELLNHFEDLLQKDRDGDRYGSGEKYVDLMFDQPELVLENTDSLFNLGNTRVDGGGSQTFGILAERSRIGRLNREVELRTTVGSMGELLPEPLSEVIIEIMAEICGTEGSAHITEIRDRASLIGDYSKDDVDGAIASLLSSDSITKTDNEEYEINNDQIEASGRKAAVAFEKYRQSIGEEMREEMKGLHRVSKEQRRTMQELAQARMRGSKHFYLTEFNRGSWRISPRDPDISINPFLPKDENPDVATEEEVELRETQQLEKLFEMKIESQLQSALEEEVKKEHWPMKSMKQKAKGEVPNVKWKIHELVMDILWGNYRAESDEATLESGETEDAQYKVPGYLPTSHIISSLKSKYGVEKSGGRISQVLGDLCGLGVLKSEKVEDGRGKKYKLTTKGKVMLKRSEKTLVDVIKL